MEKVINLDKFDFQKLDISSIVYKFHKQNELLDYIRRLEELQIQVSLLTKTDYVRRSLQNSNTQNI